MAFALSPGKVTAHVRISYTGRAERFAWVVPVASVPKLGVGSEALFTMLRNRTNPSFRVNWSPEVQSCAAFSFPSAAGAADAGAPVAGNDRPGVMVLSREDVGPYDAAILSATDAEALSKWLTDNGYDQPPAALPAIRHYVDKQMHFVAIKLRQNTGVGEIVPLSLELDEPEGCVPLVLTRIAATPDMPIRIFVVGASRAIPKNWFHVEVNPRQIDWFAGGFNYPALATAAVNEAAGHGFITEFAGAMPPEFAGTLWRLGAYDLASVRASTNVLAALQAVALLSGSLPQGSSGIVLSLLRQYAPLPADLAPQDTFVYSFPEEHAARLALLTVDGPALAQALETRLVQPLRDAQALLDAAPYLTRMFSTVSPDEMNRDPFFTLSPNLPDVSNVHVAEGTGRCEGGRILDGRLALPSGDVIQFVSEISPFGGTPWGVGQGEPSAEHIALTRPNQTPVFLTRAQAAHIDTLLMTKTAEEITSGDLGAAPKDLPTAGGMPDARTGSNLDPGEAGRAPPVVRVNGDGSPADAGCGCRVGGGGASAGASATLMGLALLVAARTRRRGERTTPSAR